MVENKRTAKPNPEDSDFTEVGFPKIVGQLFEMNNYRVRHDVHIHGAQIDIVTVVRALSVCGPGSATHSWVESSNRR
jgi:hypothetical protein